MKVLNEFEDFFIFRENDLCQKVDSKSCVFLTNNNFITTADAPPSKQIFTNFFFGQSGEEE